MAEILLVCSTTGSEIGKIDSLLRLDGHVVYVLRDPARWRDVESGRALDLIVSVIHPAKKLFAAGRGWAPLFRTPFLVVGQGPDRPRAASREERLVDRISVPFDEEDLLARVDALVRVGRAVREMASEFSADDEDASSHDTSENSGWRLARQISSILGTRIPRYARPQAPYAGVARRVAAWADSRDAFEPGHAERVATFCSLIAGRMKLPDHETALTVRAAMLHDIGKVGFPVKILRQSGPLAKAQKRLIGTHPERGATILEALNTDDAVIDAIRGHHDRVDGHGRHEISRPARILAVADVYDAMTSIQVAPALNQETAFRKILELRGGLLDTHCVDALLDVLKPRPSHVGFTGHRP